MFLCYACHGSIADFLFDLHQLIYQLIFKAIHLHINMHVRFAGVRMEYTRAYRTLTVYK